MSKVSKNRFFIIPFYPSCIHGHHHNWIAQTPFHSSFFLTVHTFLIATGFPYEDGVKTEVIAINEEEDVATTCSSDLPDTPMLCWIFWRILWLHGNFVGKLRFNESQILAILLANFGPK